MKTTEDLKAVKAETEDPKKKLAALTEEELTQVAGGVAKMEHINVKNED